MVEKYVAHFKCVKCSEIWHAIAGPTECLKCNSLYVNWLNYPIEKPNWCRICKAEFE